jgi:putative transcriptional regulator
MDVELNIDKAMESFGKAVKEITSGKPTRLRVTKVTRADFLPAPHFQPRQIVCIRKARGLTQEAFASALNVPRTTVASWEAGRKKPSGAALRLLELVEKKPNLTAPRPQVRRRNITQAVKDL